MTPVVLTETRELLICVKPRGMLSQGENGSLPALLAAERGERFLQPVHRLDREAGGLLVLARTEQAFTRLSQSLQNGAWDKHYLAVLCGVPQEPEAELRDLLYHDARRNRSFAVDRMRKGVREAVLRYQMLAQRGGRALVSVALETGRTHQIRVQFSSRGLPLCGDGRYGGGGGPMGLWCAQLELPDPRSGERLRLYAPPPAEPPFAFFQEEIAQFGKV